MINKLTTYTSVFLFSSAVTMAELKEVESYTALISAQDRQSSTGEALTSGVAVLQQDRANFFKFNKKDAIDDAGTAEFFKSAKNRALIPAMIKNSLAKGMIKQEDLDLLIEGGKIANVIVSKSEAGELYCTIAITEAS